MILKRIFLLTCAFFTFQSYCSDGSSRNQRRQPNEPIGSVAFGPNGEITGIATNEQANATGALVQKLWDMSCKDVSCNNCPRCVGKQFTQATSQVQKNTFGPRLISLLSQATLEINNK